MSRLTRHRIIYRILRTLVTPILKPLLGFDCEVFREKRPPYIVLSNHISQWDPLPIALSFPQHMYYVASEHIFRWGLTSKLIAWLVAPIARAKSTTDTRTVKDVLKAIKAGTNVCIFAEGNMTFNGETGKIPVSTGKLVKVSGAGLVTYRFEGGYFMDPRWAKVRRKGHYTGAPVRYYSPEELKSISPEELNRIILSDIYINDYAWQEKHHTPFHGKDLAEHIGLVLYCCPQCGQMETIKGSGDHITCSCGLALRYTSLGFIEGIGQDPPYKTVLDWDKWQKGLLREKVMKYLQTDCDAPFFSDPGQTLIHIERAEKGIAVLTGTLSIYRDRLQIQEDSGDKLDFPFDRIQDLAVHGRMVLIFTVLNESGPASYEVRSSIPRSALKYVDFYHLSTNNT